MSYRDIPEDGKELEALLRDIIDRLEKLERGGATAGKVSLSELITIGGIEVIVTDLVPPSRQVRWRNPANAATFDITL